MRQAESLMPHSFSDIGDAQEFVGQTPRSARVPWTRSLILRIRAFDKGDGPTRASAAVQGDRPTINAGVRPWENYAALG
jgi:hypothetical protein